MRSNPATRWSLSSMAPLSGLYLNVQADGGKFEWNHRRRRQRPGVPNYGRPRGTKHGTGETAPLQYFPRYRLRPSSPPACRRSSYPQAHVLPTDDKSSTGNRLLIGYFMVGGIPPRVVPRRRKKSHAETRGAEKFSGSSRLSSA